MSDRITEKNLQAVCDRINRTTGMPLTDYKPYDPAVGRAQPNAGAYHLNYAHGGVSLHRMSLTPGCTGVSDVFLIGHVTKRELYTAMYAFIAGLEARENQE